MSTPSLQEEYAAFVERLFLKSGSDAVDFSHAVLGISTELFELAQATDKTNLIEEMGDLCFYTRALEIVCTRALGREPQIMSSSLAGLVGGLELSLHGYDFYVQRELNLLQDEAKRWLAYGKLPEDLDITANRALMIYAATGAEYVKDRQFTPEEVLRANMRKLLVRYPGGEFDRFRAVARDTDAERVALEAAGA